MLSPEKRYKASQADSSDSAAARLLRVHELAIEAAKSGQMEGVKHCLALLRHTLDAAQSPEIALSLEAIYKDCESCIATEDTATLLEILESLRGLWEARSRVDVLLRKE